MIRTVFILFSCFLLLGARASSEDSSPSENVILIGENAGAAERYAAQELQRVLKSMTGATLAITHQREEGSRGFLIGTPNSSPLIDKSLLRSGNEEEIRIVKSNGFVTLAGATPRAALYATYAFLEESLGVRWLWPGESGEFIPKVDRLSLPEIDLSEVPDLEHRGLVITNVRHSYDEETDRWMARNRMNTAIFNPNSKIPEELVKKRQEKGFLLRLGGHNAFLPAKLLNEHPEYLAEVGGQRLQSAPNMRPPQLCWSNPAVVEAMAERMKEWCRSYPFIEMVSFIPADHARYCECTACTALGSISEQWQLFSSAVIAKIREEFPKVQFASLAYMGYRNAPEKGEAAPFDTLGYAFYNGCYRHDPAQGDAIADKPAREIRKWQEKGARIGLRGYEYIIAKDPVLMPLVSWEVEQFRWAHALKMNSYSSEVAPYGYPAENELHEQFWTTNRMNIYTAAKTAWKSRITAQELVRDWTQTIYGPGAKPMESYYWMMDEAWRSAPGHVTMFAHPSYTLAKEIITPELLEKGEKLIREAEQAIQQTAVDDAKKRALEQIALERKMLANWKKSYQYQLNQQGEWQIVLAKARGPLEQENTWESASTLATFEDKKGSPAPQQTDVKMLWSDEGLHIRIVCHDPNAAAITTLYKEHDKNLFSDECIELFLNPSTATSGYMHLAVNATGARYDARTKGGMDFDKTWNPAWEAKVHRANTAWSIDITLPFESLGVTPAEGMEWKFAIKRSRRKESGQPHSGWPDGSYHSPGAFGVIQFASQAATKKGSVVLLGHEDRVDGLKIEFLQRDWKVAVVKDANGLIQELATNPSGIVVRWMPGLPLSRDDWQKHLLPYLEKGGRVIISGSEKTPLSRWLPRQGAEVEWGIFDPVRLTSSFADGAWSRQPNDLTGIIKSRRTPPSGFTPLNETWKVLASSKRHDGTEAAYLMERAVGKGFVFLTSSGLGYGGGHEMFGHKNTKNAFQLIENLLAHHEKEDADLAGE